MNRSVAQLAVVLLLGSSSEAAGAAYGPSRASAFVSSVTLQAYSNPLARVGKASRRAVPWSLEGRDARIGCRSLLIPIKAQEDEAAPPSANKPIAEGQASIPAAQVPSPTSPPASPPAPPASSIKDAISAFSKGEIDKSDLEKLVKEKEATELEAAEKRRAEDLLKEAEAKSQLAAKKRSDVAQVVAAGATVGLVVGGLGDGAFAGGDAPWAPPAGAVALGGVAYVVAKQEGAVGETTRSVIGGFVARLLASIKAAALNTLNDAKTAVSNKVDDTVEGIKAVPRNTQAAAKQKADDLVMAIQKIPENIANAAKAAAISAKESARAKVDAIVAEVKATPGNLQKEASKAGEASLEEVKKVPGKVATAASEAATNTVDTIKAIADAQVKELVAIPTTAFEEVKVKIESLLPTPSKKEAAPTVAVSPPPAETQEAGPKVTPPPIATAAVPATRSSPGKAVAKPVPKPAAKPVPKPAAKPVPRPAAKPAPKPAAKPAVKPTAKVSPPKQALPPPKQEPKQVPAKKMPPLSAPLRTKSGAFVASTSPKSTPSAQAAKPAPAPASAPAPKAPGSPFGALFGGRGSRSTVDGKPAVAASAVTPKVAPEKAKPVTPSAKPVSQPKASTSPFSSLFGGGGKPPVKKEGMSTKEVVETATAAKPPAAKRPMLSAPMKSQAPPKAAPKKAEPPKKVAPVKEEASGGAGGGLFSMFGGGGASKPAAAPAKQAPVKVAPTKVKEGKDAVGGGFFTPALATQLLKKMDEGQLKRLEAITAEYTISGSPTAYVQSATAVVGQSVMSDILPDLVGSLPRGKQKSDLFTVYSTY